MDFDELKKHIKIIVQIYKKNERSLYGSLDKKTYDDHSLGISLYGLCSGHD